jgi:hypothetical protein
MLFLVDAPLIDVYCNILCPVNLGQVDEPNPNWLATTSFDAVQGRDTSDRNASGVVQGMLCPRDAMSKGLLVQGMLCPRTKTLRSGTHLSGTLYHIIHKCHQTLTLFYTPHG